MAGCGPFFFLRLSVFTGSQRAIWLPSLRVLGSEAYGVGFSVGALRQFCFSLKLVLFRLSGHPSKNITSGVNVDGEEPRGTNGGIDLEMVWWIGLKKYSLQQC